MAGGSVRRRTFLKVGVAVGGGLLVGIRFLDRGGDVADSGERSPGRSPPPDSGPAVLHAYVEIGLDGAVTITAPCPEIGQGVRTSLAQMVVEELDVPWTSVRARQSEANSRYGGQVVGGSDSARDYWIPLRRAGATARALLVAAAARTWSVEVAECRTEAGFVVHDGSGRRAGYAQLAADAATMVPPAARVTEKQQYRLIGTSPPGVDLDDIVAGAAVFGTDVRVPGMLRAVVARAPVHRATVRDLDAARTLATPGVRRVFALQPSVPGGDLYAAVRAGVAVVADDTWAAIAGRDELRVTWNDPGTPPEDTSRIRERLRAATSGDPSHVLRELGDVDGVLASGARVVEARYELPLLAHACMEPQNATAHARTDGCDVWGPVQTPQRLREAVAIELGLPLGSVHVHPTLAGGGFGRRLAVDYGVEAARVSREAGAPVQVLWTREDDLGQDYYRPPSAHRMRAALEGGAVVAWDHRIATPSLLSSIEATPGGTHPAIYDVQGAADFPLAVSNLRVSISSVPVELQMGSWRSVAHSFNSFAVGCFAAELAASLGRDPYDVLRELLGEPRVEDITLPLPGRRGRPRPDVARLLGVLDMAAARAEWGRPLGSGRGRGIACAEYKGSYAAHVAEVSVRAGSVRVERVVAVLDCGRVVNPAGTRAQVEGAVMDGVATVLHWGVEVRDGRVVPHNFDGYALARIGDAPRIEAHLVERSDDPAGAGEPPYPSVAPAIANAVFDAGGGRVRSLPIRAGRVSGPGD